MDETIISLTTIPPRLSKIETTLTSLIRQNIYIDEIRLNIPKRYRRFEFSPNNIPKMPRGVNVVIVDEDYGPATKVLPTALDYSSETTSILFCDDDHIYPRHWAASLINSKKNDGSTCIVTRGYDLDKRNDIWRGEIFNRIQPRAQFVRKDIKYRLKKISSLGLYIPRRRVSGYVDILQGYGGALIRPHMIPPEAFCIPDNFRLVDDPWLSGQLASRDFPIWLEATSGRGPRPTQAAPILQLQNTSQNGKGRTELDIECIQYFQNNYNIFLGVEPKEKTNQTK